VNQCTGDHGSPFHASRDLIYELMGKSGQIHEIQQLIYAPVSIPLREMVQPGMQLQVLPHRQLPVKAEMLLDYAELGLDHMGLFGHIKAIDQGTTCRRLGQSG